jgi:hypothetical protein
VPEWLLAALRHSAERFPLDEPLQARLVLALAAAGHQAQALDAYRMVSARLADEWGIDPGPELRAAHEQVLRQQPAPAAATVPACRHPVHRWCDRLSCRRTCRRSPVVVRSWPEWMRCWLAGRGRAHGGDQCDRGHGGAGKPKLGS